MSWLWILAGIIVAAALIIFTRVSISTLTGGSISEKIASAEFVVFGSDSCPYCRQAKEIVKSLGGRAKYYDLDVIRRDKTASMDLNKASRNYKYIPVIFHKGKFLVGGLGEFRSLSK